MFLWLLQWLQRKEPACDVDCPPGFGPFRIESDDHAEGSDMSSLALVGSNLSISSCTSCFCEDMDYIVKGVGNELHSSAMVSLTEYAEFSVEEEVMKLAKSFEDDKLNEVTKRDFLKSCTCTLLLTVLSMNYYQ